MPESEKYRKDPTAMYPDPNKGYNPFDNEGIKPGAQEPAGENAVNKTEPETTSGGYPAKGSGYAKGGNK